MGFLAALTTLAVLALVPQLLFKPQVRTLELSPEAIRTSIGTKQGELSWRDIARIERDANYLVITGRSGNAFVVPPTAFRPDLSIEMVYATTTEWHNATLAMRPSHER